MLLRFRAGALALAMSLLWTFPASAGRSEYRPDRPDFSGVEWASPRAFNALYAPGDEMRRAVKKRALKHKAVNRKAFRKIKAKRKRAPKHRIASGFDLARAPGAFVAMVKSAAAAAGVPAAIALAVVRQESNFNPRLTGAAGEVGLAQIKPQTAREVGFRGSRSALYEPRTNLHYGMRYLRLALKRGGPGCHGVTLYNSGIYARPHCSHYGRRVMSRVAGR